MSGKGSKWETLNKEQIQRSQRMASHLKQAREDKGLTQAEAADKVGISVAALANYEQETVYTKKFGQNLGMSADTLFQLAELYGTNTDYLLGKEKFRSPDDKVLFTCNYTGLSEDAVRQLTNLVQKCNGEYNSLKLLINAFLEDSRTYNRMMMVFDTALSSYLEYKKQENPKVASLETAWFNYKNTVGTVARGDRVFTAEEVSEVFIHKAAGTFEAILTDAMERYRKQMEANAVAAATE